MTRPALATGEDTDYGRHYRHPTDPDRPPYISVTNVADSVRDKGALEGLIGWGVKATAEYWRDNLPQAVAASMDPELLEEFVKASKEARNHVKEYASLLGSMIHARAEARVLGIDVDLAGFARTHQLWDKETGEPDVDYVQELFADADVEVDSYLQWLADFDIDLTEHVEASECTVANNTHMYAGTLDLCVWLPIDPATGDWDPTGRRHLWIVDIKSSRTRLRTNLYPGAVLQQSAYRFAEEVWAPGSIEPMPAPITGAAILNVRREKYIACSCRRQFKPGGAASHARANRDHVATTAYRALYGFLPITQDAGPEAHVAFVSAAVAVRWLHTWLDRDTPKPLDIDTKPTPRTQHTGHKGRASRTRNVDPFALAATSNEK